ncbi:hypothetical protein GYA49_06445 [Candidatus Beckwithbacteria bacterium]|nr:hypothetical protein [Candidatus Beckwithbacteria bacterium]
MPSIAEFFKGKGIPKLRINFDYIKDVSFDERYALINLAETMFNKQHTMQEIPVIGGERREFLQNLSQQSQFADFIGKRLAIITLTPSEGVDVQCDITATGNKVAQIGDHEGDLCFFLQLSHSPRLAFSAVSKNAVQVALDGDKQTPVLIVAAKIESSGTPIVSLFTPLK